jgi:transcriptional regulator with XRE-family HTH domain
VLLERAGIHRTYLRDVERGTRNICLMNIERVASTLQIKLSDLFTVVQKGS